MALDKSLNSATNKRGIYTDKDRNTLADTMSNTPRTDAVDAVADKNYGTDVYRNMLEHARQLELEMKNCARLAYLGRQTELCVIRVAEKIEKWAEDGSRPDEWILREWAASLRRIFKP